MLSDTIYAENSDEQSFAYRSERDEIFVGLKEKFSLYIIVSIFDLYGIWLE